MVLKVYELQRLVKQFHFTSCEKFVIILLRPYDAHANTTFKFWQAFSS